MQVFDDGPYDRRYEETFAPAIQSAGGTPVRADKILGSKPIIDKIEGALRNAAVAFADISEDNPNVFIELGYALDIGIPLVMVCDKSRRSSLPFDISHRPVIFYKTEAQGDFEKLFRDIESAVRAALNEARDRSALISAQAKMGRPERNNDDLKERILLEVLEGEIGDPDGISAYRIRNGLAKEGVSERLSSLGLMALEADGLLEPRTASDYNNDQFIAYRLSERGKELLLSQYADIKRTEEEKQQQLALPPREAHSPDPDLDEDVRFKSRLS